MADYSESYKIPEEIKSRIPDYFYYALWGELVSIFGAYIMEIETYLDPDETGKYEPLYNLAYVTSTGGWSEALWMTCKKLNLDFLYDYYYSLEWYDSDRFDGEIEEELYKHMPSHDNHSNDYYKYIINLHMQEKDNG